MFTRDNTIECSKISPVSISDDYSRQHMIMMMSGQNYNQERDATILTFKHDTSCNSIRGNGWRGRLEIKRKKDFKKEISEKNDFVISSTNHYLFEDEGREMLTSNEGMTIT